MKFSKTRLFISLGLITYIITACTQQIVVTATPDPRIIRTEAVQTAMAQLTIQAAANPSATPIPPQPSPRPVTATPATPVILPSATIFPTMTAIPTMTLTSVPVGNYPTFTPKPTNLNVANVLSTEPKDWSTIAANSDFDIRWWVKNVGSVEWTPAYYMQYISGTRVHRKDEYRLPHNVPVYDEIELVVDARSGTEKGLLTTRWALFDNTGRIFQYLTLNVYVK